MMQNKRVVGITGGSGSGKSYISECLKKEGFSVIDADEVAHRCLEEDRCKAEITAEFGKAVLTRGKTDRKKLGKIVFSDSEKLKKLNSITHKYILSEIDKEIKNAKSDTVFVDGAVLIESGMKCDFMIGVIAKNALRKARIMRRDGIDKIEAERRIRAQQKDGFYRKNCDFVLANNGGEPDISEIIKRVKV